MEEMPQPNELPGTWASLVYEPPRIERVLTLEELEREVLYAGHPSLL